MIELNHIYVTYDRREIMRAGDNTTEPVLKDISLKINDGEFAFIVGENCAGKSTLIKLLIREVTADRRDDVQSSINVNGYDLMSLSERDVPLLRRTIGFVFQDYKLIQSMNVYDNVAFSLRCTDAPNKYIRKRVPAVIGLMGLGSKIRQNPEKLSGGERQRVAIARALAGNPQLIIADEPTGNLDPRTSVEIISLLKKINEKGTTVVIVTHEHELVKRFGGRLINIKKGEIAFDGHV